MIHLPYPTWVARSFGYALYTSMLAIGYYYNLTFVQLGLTDLAERRLGMETRQVAFSMALLAIVTCLVALFTGFWLSRKARDRQSSLSLAAPARSLSPQSEMFYLKLKLAAGVILTQTLLTAMALGVHTQAAFLAWIAASSIALGAGVPATFGLAVDLVPRRARGYVAATITALAYLAANVLPADWRVETFVAQLRWLMPAGAVGISLLAFSPELRWARQRHLPRPGKFAAPIFTLVTGLGTLLDSLSIQHIQPEFGRGRFIRTQGAGAARPSRRLLLLILLMFGVYFVDSLGFLRMTATPILMLNAWRSPDLEPRLFIGLVHVVAALVAGVLYTAVGERALFLWVFGIFAEVHLMYTFGLSLWPGKPPALGAPMLYAVAVSLYSVVNFAIWADLSTPQTIGRNTALGVALSAWTATFISTALAVGWRAAGMPLLQHLRLVDAAAMLLFLAVLFVSLWPERRAS